MTGGDKRASLCCLDQIATFLLFLLLLLLLLSDVAVFSSPVDPRTLFTPWSESDVAKLRSGGVAC